MDQMQAQAGIEQRLEQMASEIQLQIPGAGGRKAGTRARREARLSASTHQEAAEPTLNKALNQA